MTFRIPVCRTSFHCYFFLFNCLSSHTTILSSLSTTLLFASATSATLPFSFLFSLSPLSCFAIASRLSPPASFLPVSCFRVRRPLLQRAAKTPSAAHAAPVCPASTGTPKKLLPRCSSESPTVARLTPCPPHVCGWAPA